MLASVSETQDSQQKEFQKLPQAEDLRSLDVSLLGDPTQEALLKDFASQDPMEPRVASRLRDLTTSLEFKIDTFAHGVHKIGKFRETTEEAVEKIQKNATKTLEQREEKALEENGTAGVGLRDVMRQLSRAQR